MCRLLNIFLKIDSDRSGYMDSFEFLMCVDGVRERRRALHAIDATRSARPSAPRPWFRPKLGRDLREIRATVSRSRNSESTRRGSLNSQVGRHRAEPLRGEDLQDF